MPSLTSSNNVKVTVSSSADTKGIKDTQSAVGDLSKEAENSTGKTNALTGAFGGFGKVIATVGAAFVSYQIIDKITQFGAMSVKSAADLQQTSKSFEVLTGNVKVANALFAQLANYANTTPFEFPDIAKAGQTLLGFGIQSDQVYGRIQQLGDIAAATGANFQSLALVYGQVNAAGRLYGQDALQLINNSIPVYNILSKQMGITVKEVRDKMEDGAITADIFNKALQSTTEQGGFAFKGVDTLAASFNGRLSTLKDTVTDFGRRLLGVKVDPNLGLAVEPGGIFDRMSKGIVSITGGLSNLAPAASKVFPEMLDSIKRLYDNIAPRLLPAFQDLGNVLQNNVFPAIKLLWQNAIQPLIPVLGGTLIFAIQAVVTIAARLLSIISSLTSFIMNHRIAVVNLTAAFGLLAIAMNFQRVVGAFQLQMAAAQAAIQMMRMGAMANIAAIQAGLSSLMAVLRSPWVIAFALAAGAVVIATQKLLDQKSMAEKLKDAHDKLRAATDELRDAQDRLAQAHLNVEGAQLAVEGAQRNYTQAVKDFGPDSYEARQALHELNQANQDLKSSTDDANKAQSEFNDKQKEVAKDRDLINHLNETQDSIDRVTNSAIKAGDKINLLNGKSVTVKTNKGAYGQDVLDFKATFGVGNGFATGTANAPAGWAWVGESGPELRKMNGGEQIKDASQSARMAAQGSGGSSYTIQSLVVNAPNGATISTILNSVDQDSLLASKGMTPNRGTA